MSEEILQEAPAAAAAASELSAAESVEPVILKKRGRPKGWRKKGPVDFQPAGSIVKDEMTLLKEELSRLQNQLTAIRNQNTVQGPPMQSPAFKGRPLPFPLPEGFPEIDPFAGDKTPAVVEWFRDNDPEEFAVRYKSRVTHLKPKAAKGGKDFVLDEETGQRIKLMARTEAKGDLNLTARVYGG